MTLSSSRWAALFLLCMALVVARGANAEDAARKFTPLMPKNPKAQAMIAERNAAGHKLYESFYGTKRVDWRKDRKFLKALSELDSGKKGADANAYARTENPAQASGNAGTSFSRQSGSFGSSFNPGTPSKNASSAKVGAAGSISPSMNFGGFLNAPSYWTRQINELSPYGLDAYWTSASATADFNNDGYPDIATVSDRAHLEILLNDGKGGFLPFVANKDGEQYISQLAGTVVWITPGDIDGDDLIDLVVTRWGDYDYYMTPPQFFVYLNKGNGVFSGPTIVSPTVGDHAEIGGVVVEDRDGDHKADIIAISYSDINQQFDQQGYLIHSDSDIALQTLYSNGDGTFTASPNITHYTYPEASLILPQGGAQFVNLAGTRYLAVQANVYGIGGGFSQGASVLFFQDANGGRSLPPVANVPSQQVDFATENDFAVYYSSGLSLADVNGDGRPDITINFRDFYIHGALGTAGGGFAAPRVVDNGIFTFMPTGWALADFNGDGYPDMIEQQQQYTDVWLGTADGTFLDPRVIYATTTNNSETPGNAPGNNLVAADFDRDGIIDVVLNEAGEYARGRSSVYKGRGDGTFVAAPAFGFSGALPGDLRSAQVVDLNGDGLSDAVLRTASFDIASAVNDGKGHFTYNAIALPSSDYAHFTLAGPPAAVADINGDGREDLVVFGNVLGDTLNGARIASLGVALSKGDGTFAQAKVLDNGTIALLRPNSTVLVGDLNHDGAPDIVQVYAGDVVGRPAQVHNPPGIWIALGKGDGTFQAPTYTPFGPNPYRGAGYGNSFLKDANGDGNLDLVWAISPYKVVLIPGTGTGTFATDQSTELLDVSVDGGLGVDMIKPADVNNDGKVDIVVQDFSYNDATFIYTNNGSGTFSLASKIGAPASFATAIADLNGDGCTDLFQDVTGGYWTESFYSASVWLGACDGTFQLSQTPQIPFGTATIFPGKFTNDGTISLLAAGGYSAPFVLFNQGGTKVSLTTSQKSITQGTSVSFTAGVEATWVNRPVPTGSVSFYDNGTLLGTQDVIAGSSIYSTSVLTVGSHVITISYSGDENFNPQLNIAPVNVTVTAPTPTQPEISISSSVSNVNLNRGESKTVTLALAGSATYNGTVNLSVAGATGGLGVSISPATVTLTNGAPVTVSIQLNAGATTAMARPLTRWLGSTFAIFGAFFLGVPPRRRKLWVCLLIALCVIGVCLMSTGCGDDNKGSSNSNKVSPGASTIVVTATPSVAGASVQTTSFTVTVQ